MNLTDKMKPAWLNDNSPYDGYSHLDPLENRFFKDQVEREAFMKNSQYSTQNDSRYSAINYSIIDDEDDVRYNKYEINWFSSNTTQMRLVIVINFWLICNQDTFLHSN